LEERISADAKTGVFNWGGYAQRSKRMERLPRYAIHNIHLHFCFIGEELDSGAGWPEIQFLEPRNGFVELGRNDGAVIDGDEIARALGKIPDLAALEVKLRAVAILPRLGGDDADIAREFNFTHALQRLAQDLALLLQLGSVIDVLILAPAAALEIRASGRNSRRRWLQHF